MSPKSNELNLGSWKIDDLAQTARVFAGLGSDSDLPSDIRFLANVAKLLQERIIIDKTGSDTNIPAVFLLYPTPPKIIMSSVSRIPMLNNGNTPLTGKLWFVSEVVNSGYKSEGIPQDDEELFNFITDSIQLGDVPTVIYEPRGVKPTLRFYPQGLQQPDKCEVRYINGDSVTEQRIFHVIDRIYEECLVTPDAQLRKGKLWEKAEHCWPSSDAEVIVQQHLKAGLQGHFLTCTIRHEQPTPAGRTDLEIEEKVPDQTGTIIRHALIELKVLRSFSDGGNTISLNDTLNWVEKGVNQANEYGIQKGTRLATLCCFDMRITDDNDSCFNHVLENARLKKVILKRWYLFSSSEQYRSAMNGKCSN